MDFSAGLPIIGVKFSFGLTALWWFVFTFPFLRNVSQKYGIEPVAKPVVESFRRLGKTFGHIRRHKKIFIFLIAYFFYIDGVNTIIKMASNFVDSLGVGLVVLLGSLVGIQILAFPFALLFGRMAKRFGAKQMLFAGIGVYIVITALGTLMPLVGRAAVVPIFIGVSLLVASSQGGIQAISRSFFATLIPSENVSGEFFGFYNTFGKFAAIMGPLIMGGLPRLAERMGIANERVAYSFGVGGILLLFLIGGGLLIVSTQICRKIPNRFIIEA